VTALKIGSIWRKGKAITPGRLAEKERDWLRQNRTKDDAHITEQWAALERQLEEKDLHLQELQAAFDLERRERQRNVSSRPVTQVRTQTAIRRTSDPPPRVG